MAKIGVPWYKYTMANPIRRILLHLEPGLRMAIDPTEVYVLEAMGGVTELRGRGFEPLIDVRPLGRLEELFEVHGFLRVHRNHMVNLNRVSEIRRREAGEDWELLLDPPLNTVLPISRSRIADVWQAYEGD